MQKQHKTQNLVGRKRQRKISGPGGASESKSIKLRASETLTSSKPSAPQLEKSFSTNVSTAKNTDIGTIPGTITKPVKTKTKIVDTEADLINTSPNEQAESKKQTNSATLKSKTLNTIASPKKKGKKSKLLSEVKSGPVALNDLDDAVPSSGKAKENQTKISGDKLYEHMTLEEIEKKFPILKDKVLIDRFLKVPMSNNQKGRIRQAIKLSLQDTSNNMFPDIINGKIQAILKSSVDLTDSELRRIRILYNMLKTAVEAPAELMEEGKPLKKKKDKKKTEKNKAAGDKEESKEPAVKKTKGPKRYVVFLGNLPLNINKEKIMDHFRELNEQIKDIRLPKVAEGTKSAIAYVELNNEPSYELALSKHHSMLGNKRIKVLYTTQQNSKISKSEAKGKSAKLIALQKAGKLVGSTPIVKKRSHRRTIMKRAKAKEAAANNTES